MAESAASYRDGYSGLTGTHGLPIPRTFFDLRDTIHTVNPNFREFIVKPSDFITHTLTYKDGHDELYSPNFSRYPDPSFPELHPFEILNESPDYPKTFRRAQPSRMVSPRGFRTIGELRLVDHRQVRGIGLLRPDEDFSGVPFLAPGWLDLYGPASHSDIEGTQVDQQFDSESFSAFSMAGSNAGSSPFWPFRQKVRRSMGRRLDKNLQAWTPPETDSLTLRPDREIPQNSDTTSSSYLSPFQRADHVLAGLPAQPSITSPLDVAGNWLSTVETGQQGVTLSQDSSGGALEDANLLLAGAANLLTTRSDSFTAHFRVRSFKQNPETGIWDATDPDFIVDERRFVMLIDRSNVSDPSDSPDILFLEEAPK